MKLLQFDLTNTQMLTDMTYSEYFWTLYVPIGAWMLFIMILFIVLLNKYTFASWTPENPNPYAGETLGLPRGFFRGILTMTLLFVTVLFELTNIRLGHDESNMREFLIAFQMMIAFYFGAKVMHHITSVDRQKARYLYETNYPSYYPEHNNYQEQNYPEDTSQSSQKTNDEYEDEAVG